MSAKSDVFNSFEEHPEIIGLSVGVEVEESRWFLVLMMNEIVHDA